MISLPTYRVATGSKARTRRESRSATVRPALVCQISFRNGGRLRSAPKRSRSERGAASRPGSAPGDGPARPPMLYSRGIA